MPEGDTIFRAAQTLHRALGGKVVTRFESVLPMLHIRVQVGVHANSFRGCLFRSLPCAGSVQTQPCKQVRFPSALVAIPRGACGKHIVLLAQDWQRHVVR